MDDSDHRTSGVQLRPDPYELPLYSDFSSDESVKEEKLRLILRPRLPSPERENSSSPIPSRPSRKRRRNEIEPLEDYLHFEAKLPSSASRNANEQAETSEIVHSDDHTQPRIRTIPTIWDVMAGRVNHRGFISSTPHYAMDRDNPSSSTKPVNLRAWLSRHAPSSMKYAEPPPLSQSIQDAKPKDDDLLRALHLYVSEFYAHLPNGEINFQSMDATALMAMAMLLEETMESKVGGDAWRAFMEGENSLDEFGQPVKKFFDVHTGQWQPSVLRSEESDDDEQPTILTEPMPQPQKKAKFVQRRSPSAGTSRVRPCRPCLKHHRECDHGQPCASCVAHGSDDQCQYDTGSKAQKNPRKILSCFQCYSGRQTCDRERPCGRCVRTGQAALCVYEGDSAEKMEAAEQNRIERSQRARSARSTPSRRASSAGLSGRESEMMDIDDSQSNQDSEARKLGSENVTGDNESVEMRS